MRVVWLIVPKAWTEFFSGNDAALWLDQAVQHVSFPIRQAFFPIVQLNKNLVRLAMELLLLISNQLEIKTSIFINPLFSTLFYLHTTDDSLLHDNAQFHFCYRLILTHLISYCMILQYFCLTTSILIILLLVSRLFSVHIFGGDNNNLWTRISVDNLIKRPLVSHSHQSTEKKLLYFLWYLFIHSSRYVAIFLCIEHCLILL